MGAFLGAQVAPPETKHIKKIPNQLSNRIPALKFRCPTECSLPLNVSSLKFLLRVNGGVTARIELLTISLPVNFTRPWWLRLPKPRLADHPLPFLLLHNTTAGLIPLAAVLTHLD